jgi:hypothetical protein
MTADLRREAVEAMARTAFEKRPGRYMEWSELEAKHPAGVAQWVQDFDIGLTALLSLLDARGFAVVPKVATDAMCEAAWESDGTDYVGEHHRICQFDPAYQAAVSAAPNPLQEPSNG